MSEDQVSEKWSTWLGDLLAVHRTSVKSSDTHYPRHHNLFSYFFRVKITDLSFIRIFFVHFS